MEYMTSKETSELWGISQGRIIRLAREGRIEGARLLGKRWVIPKDAAKPLDGRTRHVKNAPKDVPFRFPLFVNFPEDSFSPPLSEEESLLRQAQVDFFSCKFADALPIFSKLSQNAKSIYVRLCATAFMAALSPCYKCDIDWDMYYHRLNLGLAKDFPHKEDMKILIPWVNCLCGSYASIKDSFTFNPTYEYHPSVVYLNGFLSISQFLNNDFSTINPSASLTAHEILCRTMEKDGYFLEAQQLHRYLFVSHYLSHNEEEMLYHFKRVLSIAYEHNFIYEAADFAPYFIDTFKKVITQFPQEFGDKILKVGKKMAKSYAAFTNKYQITSLYSNISMKDYQLILYVFHGYTNKEIADIMELSIQTVANRISEIYEKLGINNRKDLISIFQASMELI